jgi:iron complex transport system ATP-binding protein
MKKKYLIELRSVSITRGGRAVLCNIDWHTRGGEHWFLMGNNGSGKTTLMEILMGYLWPQQGSVSILGERFGHVYLQDLRKQVGYVSPWIFSHTGDNIPVVDVIASGMDGSVGYGTGISPGTRLLIEQQLAFFQCEGLEKRRFGTLSSGQQLKVMLARSLIGSPRILILDEPFSMLDMGSRYTMYRYIHGICTKHAGPQLILVTHHLDDIQPVFTHGLILKNCRIFARDKRDRILHPRILSEAFDIPAESLQHPLL